jgi:hypothetical protein
MSSIEERTTSGALRDDVSHYRSVISQGSAIAAPHDALSWLLHNRDTQYDVLIDLKSSFNALVSQCPVVRK